MTVYLKRFFFIYFSLPFAFLSFFFFIFYGLQRANLFPFHHLHFIYSGPHFHKENLENLAWRYITAGFFSLNTHELAFHLLHQPWVESLSIRKEWPDALIFSVNEKRAEARWGDKGILSTHGDIFYPSLDGVSLDLPFIVAPEHFKVFSRSILLNFQKLSDALQSVALRIRTLYVDDRVGYQLLLDNGTLVIIGHQQILRRFYRFINLYPQLIDDKNKLLLSVDLRYSDGFAVRWGRALNLKHSLKEKRVNRYKYGDF